MWEGVWFQPADFSTEQYFIHSPDAKYDAFRGNNGDPGFIIRRAHSPPKHGHGMDIIRIPDIRFVGRRYNRGSFLAT